MYLYKALYHYRDADGILKSTVKVLQAPTKKDIKLLARQIAVDLDYRLVDLVESTGSDDWGK